MKQQTIRDLELNRTPNHNIKALRDYFISHGVEECDAVQMGLRVVDLIGPSIEQTPTAVVHRIAEEQKSWWKEFHL